MGKLIGILLLLLSILTISTYSLPVPEDDSNESSDSSEESKEQQISSYQPGYPNRNNCNIQKRDTVHHTNAHQGGPPLPRLSSTTLQDPSKQNENPPITQYRNSQDSKDNQNRQVRDTDEQRTAASDPISLSSTDQSAGLPTLQQNVPANTNEENQNNRQVTNGDDQQTPGRILSSNPNTPSSSEPTNSLPSLNTRTSQTGGFENRQVRETDDQQTPSRILVSDPAISSSTDRPANSYYPNSNIPASNNEENRNNRQVRNADDQQTPGRILSSNPNSPSSSEPTNSLPSLNTQTSQTGGFQNRQLRETDDQQTPSRILVSDSVISSSTDRPASSYYPNSNIPASNNEENRNNRQVRNADDQQTPGRILSSNPNSPSSSEPTNSLPSLNTQTSQTGGYQNRQVRETDDQQTPSRILVSDPVISSSTDRPASSYYPNSNIPASNNEGNQNNRQVRNADDQQTPGRILSSNPNSPSSSEPTNSLPSLNTQTSQTGGYQNRQVRDTDDQQTPRRILSSESHEAPSENTSDQKFSEKINDSIENDETKTDSSDSEPNVSSTEVPGDVYGENRKKTEASREVRDTNNQESVPRVFASNPREASSIKKPDESTNKNENSQNTEISRKVRDTNIEEQKAPPSVTVIKKPDNLPAQNQELHPYETNRHRRDTSGEDSSKILIHNLSVDGSTAIPDEVPVNVQNFEAKQHNIRETSNEEHKTTEEPDQVKIEKLDESPAYTRFQQ